MATAIVSRALSPSDFGAFAIGNAVEGVYSPPNRPFMSAMPRSLAARMLHGRTTGPILRHATAASCRLTRSHLRLTAGKA